MDTGRSAVSKGVLPTASLLPQSTSVPPVQTAMPTATTATTTTATATATGGHTSTSNSANGNVAVLQGDSREPTATWASPTPMTATTTAPATTTTTTTTATTTTLPATVAPALPLASDDDEHALATSETVPGPPTGWDTKSDVDMACRRHILKYPCRCKKAKPELKKMGKKPLRPDRESHMEPNCYGRVPRWWDLSREMRREKRTRRCDRAHDVLLGLTSVSPRSHVPYSVLGVPVCSNTFCGILQVSNHTTARLILKIREPTAEAFAVKKKKNLGRTGHLAARTKQVIQFLKSYGAQHGVVRPSRGGRGNAGPSILLPAAHTRKVVYDAYVAAYGNIPESERPTKKDGEKHVPAQALTFSSFLKLWKGHLSRIIIAKSDE